MYISSYSPKLLTVLGIKILSIFLKPSAGPLNSLKQTLETLVTVFPSITSGITTLLLLSLTYFVTSIVPSSSKVYSKLLVTSAALTPTIGIVPNRRNMARKIENVRPIFFLNVFFI